jgi:hypothetical protein
MAILQRRTSASQDDLPLVVGGLALASVLELAILRLFTRTAIHIPALEHLQQPYAWLSEGGRFAYFVSVALLVPALLLLTFALARRSPLAASSVILFALAAAAGAAGNIDRAVVDLATIGAIGFLAAAFASLLRAPASASPACFGIAFVAGGAYSVLPEVAPAGQPGWLLAAAEYTGLGFAISTPLLLGRAPTRGGYITGVAVTLLVALVFMGNTATSRFLLLWNVGLAGSMPGVLYAAAAGAIAVTALEMFRTGRRLEAAGMLLLVTGGIGLHSTYQSGLVVVGLAALVIAAKDRHALAEQSPSTPELTGEPISLR